MVKRRHDKRPTFQQRQKAIKLAREIRGSNITRYTQDAQTIRRRKVASFKQRQWQYNNRTGGYTQQRLIRTLPLDYREGLNATTPRQVLRQRHAKWKWDQENILNFGITRYQFPNFATYQFWNATLPSA